jgi:hypothetical protein
MTAYLLYFVLGVAVGGFAAGIAFAAFVWKSAERSSHAERSRWGC